MEDKISWNDVTAGVSESIQNFLETYVASKRNDTCFHRNYIFCHYFSQLFLKEWDGLD